MRWVIAKGRKTGGRDFAPGNNANPKGGGAISPETRAIRKVTLEHIEEVADLILDGNIEGLQALARDPKTSVLKVWLAKAAAEGIKRGDLHSLDSILNRVIGKPKERFEHTGKNGGAIETKNELSISILDRIAMAKEIK